MLHVTGFVFCSRPWLDEKPSKLQSGCIQLYQLKMQGLFRGQFLIFQGLKITKVGSDSHIWLNTHLPIIPNTHYRNCTRWTPRIISITLVLRTWGTAHRTCLTYKYKHEHHCHQIRAASHPHTDEPEVVPCYHIPQVTCTNHTSDSIYRHLV